MPYYAQGDNCYGRGDYYRGDYYRGDPGLLGDIFKGVKKAVRGVARVVGAFAPGPIGVIARTLVPQPGQAPGRVPFFPPEPSIPQFGPAFGPQQPVGTMTGQGFLPGVCGMKGTRPNKSSYYRAVPGNPMQGVLIPKGSVCVTTRRLNVANPRALRRSIRRIAGFAKLARRSIRWVSAKPPKGRAVAKRR